MYIYMLYIWYIYGMYGTTYLYGIYMEYVWYIYGLNIVYIRPGSVRQSGDGGGAVPNAPGLRFL